MEIEHYPLDAAQDHLKKLIVDAQQGKIVVIFDEHNHAVQLVPFVTQKKQRKAGSARGKIQIMPDFDAPLSDFDEYM